MNPDLGKMNDTREINTQDESAAVCNDRMQGNAQCTQTHYNSPLENVIRTQNRTYKEFPMAKTRMIQTNQITKIVSDYNSKYKICIHESILL